ncbi:MAG: hypothetical protein ACXV3D_08760 [Halobacteriota archaeon]
MRALRSFYECLASALDSVTPTHLATVGLIVSAAVCVVNLLTRNSYYVFVTFLALFAACALYIGLRKRFTSKAVVSMIHLSAEGESRAHKIVNIAFACLASACVVALSTAVYSRPVLFLVLASILAALIAIEIAITKNSWHVPSALLKIIILGVLIRASVYFEFPSLITADPYYHVGFIQFIIDHGSIPAHTAPYANLEYPSMPIMHLLVAALSLITGLSVYNSYFFVGVIECISVVFIFLIGRAILNARSGLLAALLLVIASQFLLWGTIITPATLGVVLTLVVVATLFLVPRTDMVSYTVLLVVMFAAILLTHEGTSAYTFLVLVFVVSSFALVSKMFSRAEDPRQLQDVKALSLHLKSLAFLVVLFGASIISYWTFSGGSALTRAVAILRGNQTSPTSILTQPAQAAAGAVGAAVPTIPFSTLPVWSELPVLILIFLATFGFLYILSVKPKKALNVAWIGVSALALVITVGIYFLGPGVSQSERWIVYLQVFMVIPAAVAILTLGSVVTRRKGLAVIFSAVLLLCFVSVTYPNAKVASELPWDQVPRIALLPSEVAAAQTIANKTAGQKLQTDGAYGVIFPYQYNASNVTKFSPLSSITSFSDNNTSWVLKLEIANNPYIAGKGLVAKLGAQQYESIEAGQNVIYDAGTVQVVTAR